MEEILPYIEEVKNILTIVKGKRDKASLERLGFSRIVMLSKKPLYQNAEDCSELAQ